MHQQALPKHCTHTHNTHQHYLIHQVCQPISSAAFPPVSGMSMHLRPTFDESSCTFLVNIRIIYFRTPFCSHRIHDGATIWCMYGDYHHRRLIGCVSRVFIFALRRNFVFPSINSSFVRHSHTSLKSHTPT